MKYINLDDIARYKKLFKKDTLNDQDMVNMVNWFAEGAITAVSNEIYELMTEQDCERMEYGLASHCRCFGCYSWQFLDENGKVLKEVDSLKELIKKAEKD